MQFNLLSAKTRIFQDNKIYTMAADALAPFVARTSAPMVLTLRINKTLFSIRKNFAFATPALRLTPYVVTDLSQDWFR